MNPDEGEGGLTPSPRLASCFDLVGLERSEGRNGRDDARRGYEVALGPEGSRVEEGGRVSTEEGSSPRVERLSWMP
jgi:hypothetical protein